MMTPTDLKQRLDARERMQLIDVRAADEFASGHIAGAIHIPAEQLASRVPDIAADLPVVVICERGGRASTVCEMLVAHRPQAVVLEGGTQAWREAGMPVVQTQKSRLPIMRQVQMLVGPIILIGVALALTVDPRWALLSGAIGLGLTIAGTTGWCGMGILLGKMPWNRG